MIFTVDDVLPERSQEEVKIMLERIGKMEIIVRTSGNPGQVERIRKEIIKYRARLSQMAPEANAQTADIDDLSRAFGMSLPTEAVIPVPIQPAATSQSAESQGEALSLVDSIEMHKASPHSSDYDINFLSTVFHLIQKEYWPAISELHTKLDFSNAGMRDSIRNKIDNVMRNLKVLAETIEEYALADKQDFREQLLKMKSKQSRIFLMESNSLLREISVFLSMLVDDISSSGSIVVNKDEIIEFNSRFEQAERLNGQTVSYAITEFNIFIKQVIKKMNLPDFKSGNR
ncbi:MAG: hypothetical protein OEZ34_02670 [Spirochaetia bacterium]|nr:hypothetical protein [Spirochaetia bacterium]